MAFIWFNLIEMVTQEFEVVIGLEVHAQLLTKSKAFCGCTTEFGAPPNTNTCPVCLGHPGALPVLNKAMVEFALKMGLATNCSIRKHSGFARKNYFYPDLPKGYQISQFDDPICYDGYLDIELSDGSSKHIGITRIHLEEDAGKSIHDLDVDTLVDLNRSGMPLIEIVSEPDIRSAHEAYQYLMQIKQIVQYLNICDGNMEEGSLRCDANVSLRPIGQIEFGTKTEVKNMNSFRNVEKAIEYEIKRQSQVLLSGGTVDHDTMMWDASAQITRVMRSKEKAHDYRYFPEPDLGTLFIDDNWVQNVRASLPELAIARKIRFISQYNLPIYDADILTQDQELANYFEKCTAFLEIQSPERFKLVSNWIMTEVMRIISEKKISADQISLNPMLIAEMADLLASDIINSKVAKEIFPTVLREGKSPKLIIQELGLAQISDYDAILSIVEKVLADNHEGIEKYRAGKSNLFGFFVGQCLKLGGGKINPNIISTILQEKLNP